MRSAERDEAAPEIHVTLCSEQNMGDHGERVRTAHRVEPEETVEHLLKRLMHLGEYQPRYRGSLPPTDWIELRYVAGTEPKATHEGTPF